jgi:hypothetical protein
VSGQAKNLHTSTCSCGKLLYDTRKEARKARRVVHPGKTMREYQCGAGWHLGHLPADVRHGKVTADHCYPRRAS